MALFHSPSIVISGLALYLDAANSRSYPGSGTAWNDLSGNNNTATLTNGPVFDSGNQGSFIFDSTNDYAVVSSSSSIPTGSQARSLNIWFYTNSTTWAENVNNLFFYGAGSTGQAFGVDFFTFPSMEFFTWGGAGRDLTWSTTFNQVGWKNLQITYDGSTSVLIYENGILTQSLTLSSATSTPSSNLYIGSVNPSIGSWYFDGRISQVSLYNRALSATEVLQNYNALRGRFGI